MAGAGMVFIAGAKLRLFIGSGILAAISIPVGWQFLHDYQKQRVLTFLDPESDPLGAGYHITQSKIAIGSGGIEGKGFMQGTQSHLNFLPEKQTDFIFTLWVEEFGLLGGLFLLFLILLIFVSGFIIAYRCRPQLRALPRTGTKLKLFALCLHQYCYGDGINSGGWSTLPLVSYGGTSCSQP